MDFDLLQRLKNVLSIPLVLHGSSGTGDDKIAKACSMGINKVNVYTDLMRAAQQESAKGVIIQVMRFMVFIKNRRRNQTQDC